MKNALKYWKKGEKDFAIYLNSFSTERLLKLREDIMDILIGRTTIMFGFFAIFPQKQYSQLPAA